MKQQSILVVDDEPDNFDVIEAFLGHQNYRLHYVANGADAIASLETVNPDVILLDVMMPGMDGIAVCQHIKALPKWRSVPIVIVTALASKAALADCLAAGADDFIAKPVVSSELRARVHSMLRIKQQYDDLQSLLKSREEMVYMIVHDLRNPLSTLSLGLEFLNQEGYPREKQLAKLAQMNRSVQTLQHAIDDLLTVAVLESGKIRLNYQTVPLCDLVQSLQSDFEAIAAQRNQFLVSQLTQADQTLRVDVALFRRVLDNLMSNALKFSPPHSSITIRTEVLKSGNAKMQIIDCGSGVPDALREKIFEKYEIGTPMPNIAQLGLGLAFCKMVVEAHGGHIAVSQNQPKGSIFEMVLPP